MKLYEIQDVIKSNLKKTYGGHKVYNGSYQILNKFIIWTQVDNDKESHGQPAANIEFDYDIISVQDNDHKRKCWRNEEQKLTAICNEINNYLEEYYSQFKCILTKEYEKYGKD